jgi:hypothetical protein
LTARSGAEAQSRWNARLPAPLGRPRWRVHPELRKAARPVGWPPCGGAGRVELVVLRSSLMLVCRARGDRASNSSMAPMRTFSFAAPAGPGCGSLRNRCGESDPPAVKPRLRHTRSPARRGGRSAPPAVATCHSTPRMYAIEVGRRWRPSRLQYHTRHNRLPSRAAAPGVWRPGSVMAPDSGSSLPWASRVRIGASIGANSLLATRRPASTSSGRTRGV